MINRAAVIVKAKSPVVEWINKVDPSCEMDLEGVNDEATVLLISHDDSEDFEVWIGDNFLTIMEDELEGWYTSRDLWPEELTLDLFNEWYDLSLHTVVEDMGDTEIVDEDYDDEDFDNDDEDDEYDYDDIDESVTA